MISFFCRQLMNIDTLAKACNFGLDLLRNLDGIQNSICYQSTPLIYIYIYFAIKKKGYHLY